MRSTATLRNSMWGIIQQVIVCVLSMFSRRVMIDTIGVEGVGLNAFLTSVITMLSLAELGIGTAIVYHMYAPIASGDRVQLARLMRTYRNIYRVIAAAIMVLGLCLLPFMDRIVSDVSYSRRYVSLIFMLFLIQTTSSYLFTYKRSMLSADQNQYIITIFDLGYKIVTIVLGIIILKLTRELAWYLVMLTVCTVLENMLISRKVDRMYPFLKEHGGRLTKAENHRIAKDVRNIFVGKVSGVITNSTDSILINTLVGTVQNGLYSNYNIILGTLSATLKQFSSAMRGSVGNLIVTEPPSHIDRVFKRLIFIMFYLAAFCACMLTGLIDPFITLAFGEGLLLDRVTVFVCILNLYMSTVDIPVWTFVSAAGLFKYDKYISITGSGINLIISFVLGKRIGMAGILLGTSATYIIQFVLKIILFYKSFLKRSCIGIFIKNLIFGALTAAECAAAAALTGMIGGVILNPYAAFAAYAVVSAAIPLVLNSLIFIKTDEFGYSLDLGKSIIKRFVPRSWHESKS